MEINSSILRRSEIQLNKFSGTHSQQWIPMAVQPGFLNVYLQKYYRTIVFFFSKERENEFVDYFILNSLFGYERYQTEHKAMVGT